MLAYTASWVSKHTFVFVAFGTVFVFVVEAAQVYAFPTIVSTARSVPVVTLGAELVVNSSFDSAFPSAATATAVVTPSGQAPVTLATSVSGTAVSVAHTVPCGEHKLRNFEARYLTMKQTIREYSCLGNLAQLI